MDRAEEILCRGAETGEFFVPHQALVEFVAATTRVRAGRKPILPLSEALRAVDDLMVEFVILYPTEKVVRMALGGASVYHLSWYDAHLWAYAAVYGIPELLSEDFQDGRHYGPVRARNPFADL